MVFDDQVSRVIQSRLFAVGIPNYLIQPLAGLFVKWGKSSGEEWVIDRMKAIKSHFIKGSHVPWMKLNRKGRLFGPFGSLHSWSMKSDRNFALALQALNCYTLIRFDLLKPSQVQKFKKAINAPVVNLPVDFHTKFFRFVRKYLGGVQQVDRSDDVSLLSFRGSPSRWRPPHSWIVPRDSTCNDVLRYLDFFKIPSNRDLACRYWSLFSPVLKGVESSFVTDCSYPSQWSPSIEQFSSYDQCDVFSLFGGEVHFLQQEGGKLRSIASPHIPFQLALRHFGKSIYRIIKDRLNWDCTFDQEKPFHPIMIHLRSGSKAHSVDLSNATDYFPLSVQETCLRAVFGHIPDIDLFCEISRSHWKSDIGVVHWTQGQPLGLYPSFGSFTMTHGFVIAYLCDQLYGEVREHDFFVLGDDVVILDDLLASKYISWLDSAGCPWSEHKSLSSDSVAEFAGRIFTAHQSFNVIKWRGISDDNFLDICRLIGPRSRSLLSRKQKLVFDRVKNFLSPFGLNYSYPGSNYQSMHDSTEAAKGAASLNVVGSLMGLSSIIRKNIYERDRGNVSYRLDEVLDIITTFDEKVISALQNLKLSFDLSSFKGSSFLEGFSGVPSALGCTEIPLKVVKPLGETTLQRYTRMLSIK